jgi:N utilization substance protein B
MVVERKGRKDIPMKRRAAREKALQSLYQTEFNNVTTEDAIRHVLEDEETVEMADINYIKGMVYGTLDHIPEIDSLLQEYLKGWKMDRLARVDRQILRLGAYEMVFCDDIPPKVAVNEAIELAKAFSAPETAKFVNGVLGQIVNDLDSIKSRLRSPI